MNCATIERQIGDLATGNDRRRNDAAVVRHLGACEACAMLLERERGVSALLREWSEPSLSDADRLRLRTTIRSAIEVEASTSRRSGSAGRAAVAASIAAAALLLGIAGLGRLGGPTENAALAGPATKDEDTEPGMFKMVGPFSEKERVEAKRTSDRSRRVESRPRGNVRRVNNPKKPSRATCSGIGAVDSDSMMRFEFQTADPKIRIIWFVPKAVDTDVAVNEVGD